jgi:hypothetical protein
LYFIEFVDYLVRSEKDLENDAIEFAPEFTHQIFGEK